MLSDIPNASATTISVFLRLQTFSALSSLHDELQKLQELKLHCGDVIFFDLINFWDMLGLSVKSLKEGPNRVFDPTLRKLSTKSLLAHCVLESILKVGCKFWDFLFENLRI